METQTQTLLEPWQCTERELRKLPLEISIPRRVECVNALRGIKHPGAAIQAAREELRSVIQQMAATGRQEADLARARRALALLEGAD